MLDESVVNHYNNWNQKVNNIKGNSTEDVFNRFISLYPIQNKLYNAVTDVLIAKGIIKEKGGDKNAATNNVITYLGADSIIKAFVDNNNQKDIDHLIQLMEHTVFHIVIDLNGKHHPYQDLALLKALKSGNNENLALAILTLIYHVRCNYVHGEKDFHEIQTLLLEPINNLLITLNHLLYTELQK